jgi:hypothetical protein
MWRNLPVEFLNGRFQHVCSMWSGIVMLKNHSHVVDPGVFARLLPPDGEVVDNSVR